MPAIVAETRGDYSVGAASAANKIQLYSRLKPLPHLTIILPFITFARRQKILDEIQRPPLGFIEHTAEIFADHTEGHKLDAAEKQDNNQQ